jgi:hypothetical protein
MLARGDLQRHRPVGRDRGRCRSGGGRDLSPRARAPRRPAAVHDADRDGGPRRGPRGARLRADQSVRRVVRHARCARVHAAASRPGAERDPPRGRPRRPEAAADGGERQRTRPQPPARCVRRRPGVPAGLPDARAVAEARARAAAARTGGGRHDRSTNRNRTRGPGQRAGVRDHAVLPALRKRVGELDPARRARGSARRLSAAGGSAPAERDHRRAGALGHAPLRALLGRRGAHYRGRGTPRQRREHDCGQLECRAARVVQTVAGRHPPTRVFRSGQDGRADPGDFRRRGSGAPAASRRGRAARPAECDSHRGAWHSARSELPRLRSRPRRRVSRHSVRSQARSRVRARHQASAVRDRRPTA